MNKNFMNPEIKIETFEMGTDILTTSGYVLTSAEQKVYELMGTEESAKGYVYKISPKVK